MKTRYILAFLLLSIISSTPATFAYRTPPGDTFPVVTAKKGRFIIEWNNSGRSYRAIYLLRNHKMKNTKRIIKRPPSQIWRHRHYDTPNLSPYFDLSYRISKEQIGNRNIFCGIHSGDKKVLKIVILDSINNLLAEKEIDWVGFANTRPFASNVVLDKNKLYIAWAYLVWDDESADMVLSRWDLDTNEIEDVFLHKRLGYNSSYSIALTDGMIGLAYSQSGPESGMHRIIFRVINADTLEEIDWVRIEYTGHFK